MNLFNSQKFATSRLIYKNGGLGENPPAGSWGKSGARDKYDADTESGREDEYKPPENIEVNERPKPIDPGPPVPGVKTLEERFPPLRPILAKLNEIGKREFFNRNPENLTGDDLGEIMDIAEKMKEAMLYRAIVEAWTEKTLYDKYAEVMADLYTRAAERPAFYEAAGQLKRGFHWFLTSENSGALPNNPYIETGINKRRLSSADRPKLMRELLRIETQLKNEILNEEILDDDRLEFAEEDTIPFYRSWIMNKGIVENGTKQAILDNYKKILRKIYEGCKKPD